MGIFTEEMTEEDRRELVGWMTQIARKHGADGVFPEAMLPRTGLTAKDESGKTLAVATLYLEKSSTIAVCGFCVANPKNRFRESADAAKLLLSVMPLYARRCGAEYLMSVFGRKSLNRILDRSGFLPGETAETKFMRL